MDKQFDQIASKLLKFDGVQKVEQLGSASGDRDEWSDLDVGVLVDKGNFDKYSPATAWIGTFGDVFAISQSSIPGKATTRVVFKDLSRVDFTFATREDLLTTSVSAPDDETVRQTVAQLLNDFCFEAVLAIAKVGREDLLIGMHLLLGLEQKCLVLAMMLRDQEHGTVHHRRGGFMNDVAGRLAGQQRLEMSSRIKGACDLFGELALKLDPQIEIDWTPITRCLELLEAK